MNDDLSRLRAACEWQLDLCVRNGSPTYSTLITSLIDRLGVDSTVTDLLAADRHDPVQSALCLRLFGAVNRLAQADPSCPLRLYYPTLGGEVDLERVVQVFFDVLSANVPYVRDALATAVQTNEVGRSAPLSAAMNYVAAATGTPLRLLEVGASAGLNLWLDRYFVAAGDVSWGSPTSALQLTGHFESGRPKTVALDVAERHGCDRSPLDVHDSRTAGLLRSFVWPEHVDRLRRLDAALEVAQAAPRLDIEAAEATDWTTRKVTALPAGYTTVIFHSLVLPYLDHGERTYLAATIRAAGAATDSSRPLAWISLEPTEEDSNTVLLSCEMWPGDQRVELARTTPHGMRVRWAPQKRQS